VQYVAVCCSILYCVVLCCSVDCMHYLAKHVLLSLLKVDNYCVVVCYRVLQYVALCCSVLQCGLYALLGETRSAVTVEGRQLLCCSVLQSVAVCCNVL